MKNQKQSQKSVTAVQQSVPMHDNSRVLLENKLDNMLGHRPSKQELEDRNILKKSSPAMEKQQALGRLNIESVLKDKIKKGPVEVPSKAQNQSSALLKAKVQQASHVKVPEVAQERAASAKAVKNAVERPKSTARVNNKQLIVHDTHNMQLIAHPAAEDMQLITASDARISRSITPAHVLLTEDGHPMSHAQKRREKKKLRQLLEKTAPRIDVNHKSLVDAHPAHKMNAVVVKKERENEPSKSRSRTSSPSKGLLQENGAGRASRTSSPARDQKQKSQGEVVSDKSHQSLPAPQKAEKKNGKQSLIENHEASVPALHEKNNKVASSSSSKTVTAAQEITLKGQPSPVMKASQKSIRVKA